VIRLFDYRKLLPELEEDVIDAVRRVLHSNRLILGPETQAFETDFAAVVGARFAVAVTSGTAALFVALRALGIGQGDEVITVSNTCVPTIAAIRMTGATPVFVDIDPLTAMIDVRLIERSISSRTRCILPVHLWGSSADMDAISKIAAGHGLSIVEDCAQAQGTRWGDRHVGTFGNAGCFSFYPTKNLGAYGDGGAVVTNDEALFTRLQSIRMYGYDASGQALVEGTNARISEIQAAVLRIKIKKLSHWIARRRQIASIYRREIRTAAIELPEEDGKGQAHSSYHQYVVRCAQRESLRDWLERRGVQSAIHYPVPVHMMPAYRFLGGDALALPETRLNAQRIVSIPIHESLSDDEARTVVAAINDFPAAL